MLFVFVVLVVLVRFLSFCVVVFCDVIRCLCFCLFFLNQTYLFVVFDVFVCLCLFELCFVVCYVRCL